MPHLPDLTPLLSWYAAHKRDLPWRATKDPYRIWISEIMLQQTRVEAVIPYYHRFLAALPDIGSLARVEETELLKLWEGLGYYSRARNLQRAARQIMAEHGGTFPRSYEEIRALPGIGDYTAGAIAAFAFGLPCPAVDGNVLRVISRLSCYEKNILDSSSKKELTEAVRSTIPRDAAGDFGQSLIELGATVCVPNGAPHCDRCPLANVCAARREGRTRELPVRIKRGSRRKEERTVLILRIGDRVALRQRPRSGLLAGLFEPLTLPRLLDANEVGEEISALGLTPLHITPLGEAKHIFTHIEWQMTGYEVILDDACERRLPEGLLLAERDEIDRLFPLPSAYRAYRAFM